MYVILNKNGRVVHQDGAMLVFRTRVHAEEWISWHTDYYTIRPILQGTKIPERMIP